MSLHLRPATLDDQDLQLRIYASTREDELAQTDWSDAQCAQFLQMQHQAQSRHYAQHYPASECHIIEREGVALGRLWLDERSDSLHVMDLSLLSAYRGQGVGSTLLKQLMARCDSEGRALSIYVEIHNPARRLYERLGFVAEGTAQGVHQFMRWQARTARSSTPLDGAPADRPHSSEESTPC